MAPAHAVRREPPLLLTGMCAALALVIAAGSSLSLAMPAIAQDTGATQSQLSWMVSAYVLVLAGLLLPFGVVADRVGRRPVLLAGLAVFAAATLVSGLLGDPVALVVLRALAGAGAAAVLPTTLSVLVDAFPLERRAAAIGTWAAVSGAGGVLGVVLAGVLLHFAWWGSIQVAIGATAAVVLALCALVVPSSRGAGVPLDPLGGALALLGLGGLVYGLVEGPVRGWADRITLTALVGGLLVLAAFVGHELRAAHPLLDVRQFGHPDLAIGSAVVFVQFFAAFGVFFLVPQWLQYVHGLPPLQSALALVPVGLGVGPTARLSPVLLRRVGARALAAWGLAQMATALALVAAQAGGAPLWRFEVCLVLFGTGFGLTLAPGVQLVMESLPPARRTVAAAVTNVARQLGGAFGGAVAASAVLAVYAADLQRLTASLPDEAAARAGSGVAQALGVAGRLGPRGEVLADGARSAFADGFGTAVLACAAVLLLGVVVCGLVAPATARTPRSGRPPGGGVPRPRRPVTATVPAVSAAVARPLSLRTRIVLVTAGTVGFFFAVAGVAAHVHSSGGGLALPPDSAVRVEE
ncbi:MFS transporter [Blastococcus sp. SYSU D00669]